MICFISVMFGITNKVSAAPDINVKDGKIIIKITSHAATTSIRYKTVGFYITTKEQKNMVKYKTYEGPDAPISPGKEIYLSEDYADVEYGKVINGETTTTFTFDESYVKQVMKEIVDIDKLETATTIYFNAIFRTYQVVNGNEVYYPGTERTWLEIMSAQSWGADSLSNFKEYYNIANEYIPGLQANTLYYDYNGTSEKQCLLDPLFIGETLRWYREAEKTFSKGENTYKISGYKILNALTKKKVVEKYIDADGITADQILNAYIKVQYGGMDVHLIYELDESTIEYANTLYYEYNGTKKLVGDLDKKIAGSKVTWSIKMNANPPGSIFGSGTYQLQGYYIKAKDSSVKLQGVTSLYRSVDNATESQIKTASAIVVKGGINVYIVYGNVPTPSPSPIPSLTVTPTPAPTPIVTPLVIPEGGREQQDMGTPVSTGIIRADNRGQERFVVESGIPTTESLYTQVNTTPYLIGYEFEKVVVIKEYNVKATKNYHLSWKDATGTKTVTKTETITQAVTIRRACAYWTIKSLDYYTIDHAEIYNKALPDGKSIMYPDANYYGAPDLSTNKNSSDSYHMIDPVENNGTVMLESVSLSSSGASKPVINAGNLFFEADDKVGEIMVRSDYVAFQGVVVMNSSLVEKEAPDLQNLNVLKQPKNMTDDSALYKSNQIIEPTLANDTYSSTGNMIYKKHSDAISGKVGELNNMIVNINNVKVHTPVICDPIISCNNKKWVQLITPNKNSVPLVIDPESELSDFTVEISNTGLHSYRTGYMTRNMAWSLRSPNVVSYLAKFKTIYRNEVRFPFDVFRKSTDGEDQYIPKETWIAIAFTTPTFYLPMWVEEGDYTVNFRTIAVNATTDEKINIRTEKYANTIPSNYVATNTVKVQVSGRIYGLTITDVSDKRDWEEVFHYKGMTALKIDGNYANGVIRSKYDLNCAYDYKVGTRNQYGNETGRLARFTLPLVNGSHPRWSNIGILKKGYSVNFRLTTTGSRYGSGDSILIRPKFYYVDAKGNNRKEVDIYYSQYFNEKSNHLVKIGGAKDKTNINTYKTEEIVPDAAWKTMADIFNVSHGTYRNKKLDLFTYSKIRIFMPLMTYSNLNYLQTTKNSSEYPDIKDQGIKPADIMKRMQTWYGEYWLPADIHTVAKGYDVMKYASTKGIKYDEPFWLTGGYIIVNFEIVTLDSTGKEQLSYTNTDNALNGYCSMWNMENGAGNKKSYNGKAKGSIEFKFEPGDFMVYYSDLSVRDDYDTYLIN